MGTVIVAKPPEKIALELYLLVSGKSIVRTAFRSGLIKVLVSMDSLACPIFHVFHLCTNFYSYSRASAHSHIQLYAETGRLPLPQYTTEGGTELYSSMTNLYQTAGVMPGSDFLKASGPSWELRLL